MAAISGPCAQVRGPGLDVEIESLHHLLDEPPDRVRRRWYAPVTWMTRRWAQWVFNFAVLTAIVLLLAGMGWLFAQAIESGSAFLGAVLASGATVGAVVLGRFHERRKEAEATRRRELGSLYEGMVGSVTGQPFTDRKREKMIVDFMRKTIVYASPGVIKAFRHWRENLPDDDATFAEQRASMVR